MNRQQMRNRIRAVTNGFRTKPVKEEDVHPDAVKIVDILYRNQLGNANAELMEVLTGYPITRLYQEKNKKARTSIVKPLVAVVTLGNFRLPSYTSNEPVVVSSYMSCAYKRDGTLGNSLPDTIDSIRLATDEEIGELTDAQLDAMIKEYTA